MTRIDWCPWHKIINEKFIPLVDNKDRYLILYGSRGSSKSNFAAKKLIFRCLSEKYFRFILIRNEYNKIQDSSYKEIKDCVEELGLSDLFTFNTSPLRITCENGNSFIARGCDDPASLKSIKDPTGVWWEEDIPLEDDFKIISKSIRTSKAEYLQEIFTINPEIEGDYTQNWFFKRFFSNHYPEKLTFTDHQTIELDETEVVITYSCQHSTVMDNRWATDEYKAILASETDSHRYKIDYLGLWSRRITGGQFYKKFDSKKHAVTVHYDPNLPLFLSWDENVNPYLPCGIFQVKGKTTYLVDLILGRSPNNTIKYVCDEIKRKYFRHRSGMYIDGDATAKKEDVKLEKGHNFYKLIARELEMFKPVIRVPASNPPVMMRGMFINTVLESNFNEVRILINKELHEAVTDMEQTKEAADGGKDKKTVRDPKTGISYQPTGHITDLLDYHVCRVFKEDFDEFQKGPKENVKRVIGTQKPITNNRL